MVRATRCRAFTLVELLVTIGIIGILTGLLMPAVQRTRESARRISCVNNLRQIGLAVHNYESAFARYPKTFGTTARENLLGTGASWSIHGRILPYMERSAAFERVDLSLDWHNQIESGVTALQLPFYLCPSEPNDDYRTKLGKPYVAPQTYGFNFGTWMIYNPRTGAVGDGAFVVNNPTRPASIRDGLSHTMAASEVKTYQAYLRNTPDPGGGFPTSRLALQNMHGEFRKTGHTVWPDGRVHHSGITTVFTPNTRVVWADRADRHDIDFTSQQEGKSATRITYAAITSRSYHASLVNTLMMDGSVRVTTDGIDPKLWRSLGTRNGREILAPTR